MIKILLVEDEPPILRDLVDQVENFSTICQIAATATNGQDAIDIINTSFDSINVLITDIQMPVVDGLELILHVKKNYPHIICVILSGYSDFDYAKKAIKLGVNDYLLKPIQEDELKNLLENIYANIIDENISREFNNRSITNGTIPAKDTNPNSNEHYVAGVLCLGILPIYQSSIPIYSEKTWIAGYKLSLSNFDNDSSISYWIFDGKTPSEKNFFFTFKDKTQDDIDYLLHKFYSNLKFTIFYTMTTATIPSINHVGNTIKSLRNILKNNITLGKSQYIISNQVQSDVKIITDTTQLNLSVHQLIIHFRNNQFSLFKTEFFNFIHQLNMKSIDQTNLFNLLYSLMNLCIATGSSSQPYNTIEYVSDALYLSSTYDELSNNLIDIFEDIYKNSILLDTNSNSKEELIYKIDIYIKQHYQEDINTQSISQYFNFSPAYLSKVFREFKNISPTSYITELRIEKSKQIMLQNPSLKLKDIALTIGYNDALYFSKVFKKQTGCSPSQFIKQHLTFTS